MTIDTSIEKLMDSLGEARGSIWVVQRPNPELVATLHGPFDTWNQAMAWAQQADGIVLPVFPVKDNK